MFLLCDRFKRKVFAEARVDAFTSYAVCEDILRLHKRSYRYFVADLPINTSRFTFKRFWLGVG